VVVAAEEVVVQEAAVAEVVREQAVRAEAMAVVPAVTMPRLLSMPKRFARFCAALRRYARLRRRIMKS
jgi:hypothetical protein